MDIILAQAAKYSVGLAFRSGLSIAGTFAIRQVSNYIKKVPLDTQRIQLEVLSKRLDQKIRIITPAIDLIEIIAARGNTTLSSTVQLTVALRNDINAFGRRMNELPDQSPEDSIKVLEDMSQLLARIEDAVPLISLALTTSGANLSASLPNTVSPSRLLQASSAIQSADAKYDLKGVETQVGPSFSLKLYTIFEGHAREGVSNITWQETYAKCILEVIRVPDDGMNYSFKVTEDMNDSRYHEEIADKTVLPDHQGFIRGASREIPVVSIARLFFSASGRLLNIDDARTPVLVLKINHALDGNPTEEDEIDPNDIEWLAFELWEKEVDDEEEEEVDDLAMQLQVLDTNDPTDASLSLLEYILRLSSLQISEQVSILRITDERISLYLRDDQGPQRRQEKEVIRRVSGMDSPASSVTYNDLTHTPKSEASTSKVSGKKSKSVENEKWSVSPSLRSNVFAKADDLQTRTNNGFASKLRHS